MGERVFIIIAFILSIVVGSLWYSRGAIAPQSKQIIAQKKLASQIIQFSPKSEKRFDNIQVERNTTALELLSKYTTVITKGEKEQAFITSIDQKTADAKKREFWSFYVNGKQAEVGAGSYKVQNNDTILWKIETY